MFTFWKKIFINILRRVISDFSLSRGFEKSKKSRAAHNKGKRPISFVFL